MRFVRFREWDARHGGGYIEISDKRDDRCPDCMEGNNINRNKEDNAKTAYLSNWHRTSHLRANQPTQAEQAKAYRLAWLAAQGITVSRKSRRMQIAPEYTPWPEYTPSAPAPDPFEPFTVVRPVDESDVWFP